MEGNFSEAEANSLLPQLTDLLTRLQRAHTELRATERTAQRRASSNGAVTSALAADVTAEYARLLGAINSLGILVRDPESGLVDFPAIRDGDPVYLCWRLGEAGVGFWHPRDTGFTGREPL